MQEGDIIYYGDKNDCRILKILRITADKRIYHCMPYTFQYELPALDSKTSTKLHIQHLPMNGESIEKNYSVLTNIPVLDSELTYYFEYLKQTDIRTYCLETKQNIKELLQEVNNYIVRGNACAYRGDFRKAVEQFLKAIEIFPYDPISLTRLGQVYLKIGNLLAALENLEYAYSIYPDYPPLVISLGECYIKLRDIQKIKEIIKQIKKINPIFSSTRIWMQKARWQIFLLTLFKSKH
jgi:tetratricopeptide (TPR) repeat protein